MRLSAERLRAISGTRRFKKIVDDLYESRSGVHFMQRLQDASDAFEEIGLVCGEHPTVNRAVLITENVSRVRPSMIVLHSGLPSLNSVYTERRGAITLDILEARSHELEGPRSYAAARAEAQSGALFE